MQPSEIISKLLGSLLQGRLVKLEKRNENEIEDLEHLVKKSKEINRLMGEVDEKLGVGTPCYENDYEKDCEKNSEKVDHNLKSVSTRKSRNIDPDVAMFEMKSLKTNRTTTNLKLNPKIGKSVDKKEKEKEKSLTRDKSNIGRTARNTVNTLNITTETNGAIASAKNYPKTPKKQETTLNTSRPSTKVPGKTPIKKKTTLKSSSKEPGIKKNTTMKNLIENNKSGKNTPRVSKEPPKTSRNTGSTKQLIKKAPQTSSNNNLKKVASKKKKESLVLNTEEDNNEKSIRISTIELTDENGNCIGDDTKDKINGDINITSPFLVTNVDSSSKDDIGNIEVQDNNNTNLQNLPAYSPVPISESLIQLSEPYKPNKIPQILAFLNKSEKINIFLVNKLIGQSSIEILLNEAKKDLEEAENKLAAYKSKNSDSNNELLNPSETPFTITRGASRALDLLNEAMYNKVFAPNSNPNEDVKLIYRIFFQLLNLRHISKIPNSSEFWKECSKYLLTEGGGKTGTLISNLIPKFDFSDKNIYRLNKMLGNNTAKIAPAHFSKICGTTGLFIFLIKDALEYAGIIYMDKKTPSGRVLQNLTAFVQYEKEKVERLTNLFDKIK